MLLKFKDILPRFLITLVKSGENSEWRFCLPKPLIMSHIYPQGPVKGPRGKGGWVVHIMWFLQGQGEWAFFSTEVTAPPRLPRLYASWSFLSGFRHPQTLSVGLCFHLPVMNLLSLASLALSHIFLLRFVSHQIFSSHLFWPAFALSDVLVSGYFFKKLVIISLIQLIV